MIRPKKNILLALVAVVLLASAGWVYYLQTRTPPDDGPPTYVGSQTCSACHDKQGQQWLGSHHQLAMAEANPATVHGNFDDQRFTHQGITSRLFRKEDKFFIDTDGPTGKIETFPILYTFGVAPLQQYLVDFPRGRKQALSITWDTHKKRWFHLYPDEKIPYTDSLHWTKPLQNWNYMCAECHSTNLQRNYDLATDSYRTTYAEISVGCEACHGPGSTHVKLAKTWSIWRDRRWEKDTGFALAQLNSQKAEIDTCAMCHSRRSIVAPDFKPGHDYLDHYLPELLDKDGIYFPDGQIQDEVYEYTSFLQSKMYRMNVRCSDCHNPHAAKPRAPSPQPLSPEGRGVGVRGNDLCARCHVPTKYDTPAHHHHQAGSQGALCVECHMPTRTYMVVHPRRDHSIRVPRPDLSVTLGTPNACNACHKDKSAEWARDQVTTWYGPKRADDPHYGPAIAAGRAGKPEGEQLLLDLCRRKDVGPVVYATAVSLLGRYASDGSRGMRMKALTNPEALVRYAAVRSLENQPHDELRRALPPLLEDKVRLVRTEAARVMSVVPKNWLSGKQLDTFKRAFGEYEQSQLATSEQAVAHHNLGIVYTNLKQVDKAEKAYQTANRLDPNFVPARYNLAMLYNEQDNKRAAMRVLKELTAIAPDMADAHYSLGLLLAEDERLLPEAEKALAKAAKLSPKHARIQYNHGLAMQRLGKPREAETALLSAHKLEPNAKDYVYALAVLCSQEKRWADALRWIDQAIRLDPSNIDYREFRGLILQSAAK